MSEYVWPGPGVVTVHGLAHRPDPPIVITEGEVIDTADPALPAPIREWIRAHGTPVPESEDETS